MYTPVPQGKQIINPTIIHLSISVSSVPSITPELVSSAVTTMPPTLSDIRLPRNRFSPVHYRLKIKPDFYDYNDTSSYRFNGTVDVQFRCLENTTSIVLHANQLVIDSYLLMGSNGSQLTVKKLEENKDMEWLTFILDEALVAGRDYVLRVIFSGPLKDDMEGIYWSSYQENNITKYLPLFPRLFQYPFSLLIY